MPGQSIKEKTVKGVFWNGIDNLSQFIVGFVVSIILARILSPEDYGLIGIILIFTSVCDAIIAGGFGTAIIRKIAPTENDYNTAFFTNLTLSIFLYAIIFICSPLIADFFGRQELVALTRVSSLSMIIGAMSMVQQTRLTKNINFKTQTKITLISSLLSGILGISMAFFGFGVWALVAQGLASKTCCTILFWIFNKWIPSLKFSKDSFNELFGFGWKMMLSQVINSIYNQLYQVIVGKFYNPATLGQYTRAKNFSQILSGNLTSVIQKVTYPMLSAVQDNKDRMISAYRRTIKVSMFFTLILCFSLGAVSEPLIYCLIGPKWHEAALYLPFICFVAAFYPLHSLNLNMLEVQGRSDLFLFLEIIKKIIGVVPLAIGALVGILPMLYVSILTNFISYFLNSYYSGKLLGYNSWMQLRDIAPSFIIASITAISVYFIKYLPLSYWLILPIQILFGVFVFFILCRLTKSKEYDEIKIIIQPFIKQI